MKVFGTEDEVVLVEFTKDELFSCNLTYEKLESNSPASKAAVLRIISEIGRISGKDIRMTENTKVDFLPDGDEGCLIVVNNKRSKKTFEKLKIYESDSIDAIIDFAKSTGKSKEAVASLYKKENLYRLVLFAERKDHLKCSEFLFLHSEGQEGFSETKKHFHCVISRDALKILGGFAS